MSNSDSDDLMTPPELKISAQAVIENLLPEKSRHRYNKAYEDFVQWKTDRKAPTFSENVLLSYFSQLGQKYKPSTLWSLYSMLKSTILSRNDINIMEYRKLTAFLKRKSEGFRSKKSKVFTTKDVYSFLQCAPDEKYLLMKVILILGINGACRSQELIDITTDDIEFHENVIIVKLPKTKTKIERTFVISGLFHDIVKKYIKLRPNDINTKRFLVQYRNEKCTKQVIGKNKISSVPKDIASYLNLPNPEDYTGHCLRRTSATILADTGADLTTIKRHGGWKSSAVAESYIENSLENKTKINDQIAKSIITHTCHEQSTMSMGDASIQTVEPQPSTSAVPTAQPVISSSSKTINLPNKNISLNFNNCTNFNINFNN